MPGGEAGGAGGGAGRMREYLEQLRLQVNSIAKDVAEQAIEVTVENVSRGGTESMPSQTEQAISQEVRLKKINSRHS